MGSENEPAKLLLPYLQRADELQKHEPLVAYYCRLYAMERGMRISPKERTKTTNAILVSLMNQLEKDKKSLKLGPEDNLYVEGFASNVFAKADKQDRAARADLNTAKTFYAASIFFEILNQFGELQPDLEQKQKYAAWKAADIRKALKEGRKPEPGPPGGDKDLSFLSSTSFNAYDLGSSEPSSANQPGVGSDASTEFHDNINHHQPSTNTLPSHSFPTSDYPSNDFKTPSQFHDNNNNNNVNYQASPKNISSPSYPTSDYPPNDFNAPPPPSPPPPPPEDPSYPQPYHHQPYPHESQPPLPQNYPSHESPSSLYSHETPPSIYSLPNFQSYPSFTDTNLPTAPSHYPSYYQGSDASFSHQSAPPPATNYSSPPNYTSNSRNGSHQEPVPEIPVSAPTFQYDSNYQPPPDKIAEAHKAARFAVGALAFDDVSVAVDFLIKSLELLTKPSASK